MQDTTDTSPNSAADTITGTGTDSATSPSSTFIDFLLGEFRCAGLRARIVANEIEATAVALAAGLIDGEVALACLQESGLLDLVTGPSS